ncbi:hypothetical protein B0T25DRAFT_309569 [Lasiosphaeria hispida]|uniref:Uncharacterized protein n=1 Tax=Lasiosphaeria hispida TaxID=260671 RepID=A0AAJ0H989_9PEZI|nr:hypothetical protein B0T25DRAFT_309569 [Lasiosphaeria hispida]
MNRPGPNRSTSHHPPSQSASHLRYVDKFTLPLCELSRHYVVAPFPTVRSFVPMSPLLPNILLIPGWCRNRRITRTGTANGSAANLGLSRLGLNPNRTLHMCNGENDPASARLCGWKDRAADESVSSLLPAQPALGPRCRSVLCGYAVCQYLTQVRGRHGCRVPSGFVAVPVAHLVWHSRQARRIATLAVCQSLPCFLSWSGARSIKERPPLHTSPSRWWLDLGSFLDLPPLCS